MNVFITGISRGIGLGLTQLALEKGHQVIGTVRHLQEAQDLKHLKDRFPKDLQILELDLRQEEAPDLISQSVASLQQIDLLINNAGILEEGVSKESFLKSFEVNTYVPFMVTQALLTKLKKSSTPKMAQISSTMGSIEDNQSGGYYAYRSSKAALNMITKSLTVDHPWLTTVVLHPGWVRTRMGGPDATTSVSDSTQGLWKVIENLTPADSGSFIDFHGSRLPW